MTRPAEMCSKRLHSARLLRTAAGELRYIGVWSAMSDLEADDPEHLNPDISVRARASLPGHAQFCQPHMLTALAPRGVDMGSLFATRFVRLFAYGALSVVLVL